MQFYKDILKVFIKLSKIIKLLNKYNVVAKINNQKVLVKCSLDYTSCYSTAGL